MGRLRQGTESEGNTMTDKELDKLLRNYLLSDPEMGGLGQYTYNLPDTLLLIAKALERLATVINRKMPDVAEDE